MKDKTTLMLLQVVNLFCPTMLTIYRIFKPHSGHFERMQY